MNNYEIQNSDAAETVAKVLRLTRQDTLEWEATADPHHLIAPFQGEYIFELSRFEDPKPEPYGSVEYGLSVVKKRRAVVSFGSGAFSRGRDLQTDLGEPETKTAVRKDFEELWKRAFYRANQVPEELERINKLLDSALVHASH